VTNDDNNGWDEYMITLKVMPKKNLINTHLISYKYTNSRKQSVLLFHWLGFIEHLFNSEHLLFK